MKASDEAMGKLCESLAAEIGAGVDFQLDLGELIGRYRRRHERNMLEVEAARLLPNGAEVVAERQRCHRATAYRRAARANVVARKIPDATTP